MKSAYVQLTRTKTGRWMFSKINRNGRKTETSQSYAYRKGAIAAARRDVPGVEIRG